MWYDSENDLHCYYDERLHVHVTDVEGEEAWLIEEGFQKGNQWCLEHQKFEDFYIRRRYNESESHAYVSGAIHEFIANVMKAESKLLATRDADVVFFANGKKWGIEVETGTVYRKGQAKVWKKVELLQKRYGNRWFIVVTNKHDLAKYRKFGKTVSRKEAFPLIRKIFNGKYEPRKRAKNAENLHP